MHKGTYSNRGSIPGFLFILFVVLLCFPTNAFVQDNKGVQELTRDLQDKEPLVRRIAAEQLGRTHDARAVEPLIEALQDEDAGVRREVTKSLGEIGDSRAVKPLGTMLDDSEEFVRVHALGALEKIGGDEAVDMLIAALKNANPLVRMNAAASLGRIKNTKAIDHLEEVAQKDAISHVRFAAQQAVAQIRGEGNVTPPEKAQIRRDGAVDYKIRLITEREQVAERIKDEYGMLLDYQHYDIMDLLDIESRMRMRHSQDTIESVLGDLLTETDKERNKHLFAPKQ